MLCPECGGAELELRQMYGRIYRFGGGVTVELPAWLMLPSCAVCKWYVHDALEGETIDRAVLELLEREGADA